MATVGLVRLPTYERSVLTPLENATLEEVEFTIEEYKQDMFYMVLELSPEKRELLNAFAKHETEAPVWNALYRVRQVYPNIKHSTVRGLRKNTLRKLNRILEEKRMVRQ